MLKHIIMGLILGWGAAIPLGPLNIEIIRRNLRYGFSQGFALGLGACSVDITYLIIISYGMILILTHTLILKIVSVVGALVLGWFGIQALRMKSEDGNTLNQNNKDLKQNLLTHYIQGYILTFVNPYTILFWSSISSQVVLYNRHEPHALLWTGLGVLVGTVSWATSLNVVIHVIRHKISAKIMHRLNIIGGIILLGFAVYGLIHSGGIHG